MPDMPPRPTLPPHLLAQLPNNIAAQPLTREQATKFVDILIQGLQQLPINLKVQADKDPAGWTIRINLPKT
jgi:hypothetical protein